MGLGQQPIDGEHLKLLYVNICSAMPTDCRVIVQGSAEVRTFIDSFHDAVELKGMLDSGSMAGRPTISEAAEHRLRETGVLPEETPATENVVLVSCESGPNRSRHYILLLATPPSMKPQGLFAPFHLMFGHNPRLPIDVMFQTVVQEPVVVDKHILQDPYLKLAVMLGSRNLPVPQSQREASGGSGRVGK